MWNATFILFCSALHPFTVQSKGVFLDSTTNPKSSRNWTHPWHFPLLPGREKHFRLAEKAAEMLSKRTEIC